MRTSFIALSLWALVLPYVALAGHVPHRRQHNTLARRANNTVQLHKRFYNARFTFYDVGL